MSLAGNHRVPTWVAVCYGFATLGTGNFLVVPQLFLLYFMTERLGIPPYLAAITLLLPKLWEFITDPLIGSIADNPRYGSRRRELLMVAGAVSLSLGIAWVFTVPFAGPPLASWLYITIMFVLATTGYALFSVPYTMLLADMTKSRAERTRLVAIRMGFLGVSLLLAAILWPWVLDALGGQRFGYTVMGLLVGGVCGASMLVTILGVPRTAPDNKQVHSRSLRSAVVGAFSNQNFSLLALGYFACMVAQSASSSLIAFAGTYISPFGTKFLAYYFGALTAASVVAIPVWYAVSTIASKKTCFMAGAVAGAVGFALTGIWLEQPGYGVLVAAVVTGSGVAASQVFGFSILADLASEGAERGESGGLLTGCWVGLEKLGLAAGATAASVLIGVAGFIPTTTGGVQQPQSALQAILWMFAFIPAALTFVAVVPLSLLRLHESHLTKVRKLP